MPILLPKDKICPVLTVAQTDKDEGFVYCQGEKCAWFKGREDQVDGICAVSDIPGWLKNLHELAQKSGQPRKVKPQKPKPEEDEEVGPEDR